MVRVDSMRQVDALELERAPEPFDQDVGHPPAPAVYRVLHPSLFNTEANPSLGNWCP
jgi:hypothetical protein